MPKIPPYSKEVRIEAVRLLRSSGRSVPQLARELGCSSQSLSNWARQLDVDEGKADGLTSDEREELRRLRRENRILAISPHTLRHTAAMRLLNAGNDITVIALWLGHDSAPPRARCERSRSQRTGATPSRQAAERVGGLLGRRGDQRGARERSAALTRDGGRQAHMCIRRAAL